MKAFVSEWNQWPGAVGDRLLPQIFLGVLIGWRLPKQPPKPQVGPP